MRVIVSSVENTLATFSFLPIFHATMAEVKMHIFASEKGDYYQIPMGVPQFPTVPTH